MPSVSITWHTQHDDRVCPVCRAIDNYTWTFTDEVPSSLTHPQYGEVWNTTQGSYAHEQHLKKSKTGTIPTCRCHIEPKFNLKDLVEKIRVFRDEVKASLQAIEGEAT